MQSRIHLAGFSFVVASLTFCGTAAIVAQVPAMAIVEKAFEPTDLPGLRSRMHRRVVVEGRIIGAGESKTGSVRYLNFTKNYRESVSLVFFTREKEKGFTKEGLSGYVGRRVRVGGLLSERSGALQIQIFDFEQIRLLP